MNKIKKIINGNILDFFDITLAFYNILLIPKILFEIFKYNKYLILAKSNFKLKKYKHNDICYICGNGPSLNDVNFDSIDEDIIVVNDFYKKGKLLKKKPTFYMIADRSYGIPEFEDKMEEIINYSEGITKIFTVKIADSIKNKYKAESIFFFNPIGFLYKSGKKIDFTRIVDKAWNVVSWAIMFAIYLEYKEIRLIGLDYNLFAHTEVQHFYKEDSVFLLDNRKNSKRQLLKMLFSYSYATNIHYELKKEADNKRIKIINMTNGSLLDAYPKK